jgi:hypothetical protein
VLRYKDEIALNLSAYMVELDKPLGLTLAPDPATGQVMMMLSLSLGLGFRLRFGFRLGYRLGFGFGFGLGFGFGSLVFGLGLGFGSNTSVNEAAPFGHTASGDDDDGFYSRV